MQKIGYLKEKNGFNADDINLKNLDIIIISFAKVIDKKGTVTLDLVDREKLQKFIADNGHIKFYLAIGGWGADNFSEAVESFENRKNFIDCTINIVEYLNLCGVDLDWEYPCMSSGIISCHPNDKFNFTKLMIELRKELDQLSNKYDRQYYLSFAAGATENMVDNLELEKLYDVVDHLNLMTYDMGGCYATTGHQTSIYPSNITNQKGGDYFIKQFIKAGFPKDKIVYGCAFYGRGATGVKSLGSGICERIYGEQGLFINYEEIVKLIDDKKTTEYFDDEAVASYCFDGDTYYTYDSPKTILKKIEYVKEMQLYGIMFWECATDQSGVLLNTLINEK